MSNVIPIGRARSTTPASSSPWPEVRGRAASPNDYLARLAAWRETDEYQAGEREYQLYLSVGAWRKMVVSDPSDCHALAQLDAAIAAWREHLASMHMAGGPEAG